MNFRRKVGIGIVAGLALLPAVPGCAMQQQEDVRVMAKTAKAVELGAGPVRVKLDVPKLAPRAGKRLYIVLREFEAKTPPGVLYHLYLDLPEGVKPAKDDPRHVGAINFFDAGFGPKDAFTSFDITDLARTLAAKRLLTERTTLTILPLRQPEAGSRPVIGRIELLEQ